MYYQKGQHSEFASAVSEVLGREVLPNPRARLAEGRIEAYIEFSVGIDTPLGVRYVNEVFPFEMSAQDAAMCFLVRARGFFLPWLKALKVHDKDILRVAGHSNLPDWQASHQIALASFKYASEEEKLSSFIRAGLLTEDGELHPRYASKTDEEE